MNGHSHSAQTLFRGALIALNYYQLIRTNMTEALESSRDDTGSINAY